MFMTGCLDWWLIIFTWLKSTSSSLALKINNNMKGHRMKLTDAEKLSLLLLCDIAEGKNDIDTALIREAIFSENTWAIPWQMNGIPFENAETPEYVAKTCSILDMFSALELAYADLDPTDKARVDASPFGYAHKLRGFDFNSEYKYVSVVKMLVLHMDRFTEFTGRESLNAHAPMVENYLSMLEEFEKYDEVTADVIIAVTEAINKS
jgi:uncharacterized protein